MINGSSNNPNISHAGILSMGSISRCLRVRIWLQGALIFFATLFGMVSPAHSAEYQFDHLGIADGLSNTTVTSIIQDHHGFLWFGTMDGLNRYDGYRFMVFRNDIQDSTSLGSNRILSVFEDRSKVLWVGTETAGLNRYDSATGRFYRYTNHSSDPHSLSDNQVESICEDRSGTLWVGTKNGLNRLDRKTGTFTRYFNRPNDFSSLFDSHIGAILEDTDGDIWIGGGECLHRFNPNNGTFTRFRPRIPYSEGLSIIGSIVEGPRGVFWISTWGNGLWRFDKASGAFTVFHHDSGKSGSLCNNTVGHLALDGNGNLWIGTADGLDILKKGSEEFIHCSHDVDDDSSISANGIWAVFQDRSGVLWIGAYSGGLNKMVPSRMIYAHHTNNPKNPNSLSNNNICTVFESRDGDLWIGTQRGLNRFDRKTDSFTVYHKRSGGLSSDYIKAVWEDAAGIFWIGTSGGGLNRFDPRNKQFRYYQANSYDLYSLNDDWINRIVGDDNGKLLIGTQSGLNRFDPLTGKFANLSDISGKADCTALYREKTGIIWFGSTTGLSRYDPSKKKTTKFISSPYDSTTLSNDYIHAIYEDPSGQLWIGTAVGLNRFDRVTGRFTRYTSRHGLNNESINDIVGDSHGNIWMCTNVGISRLKQQTLEIRNYGFRDGLPFQAFDESCILKTRNGEFVIGGQEGFFIFRSESSPKGGQTPPVVITGFKGINREIKLDRPIWETDRIVLTHRDYDFVFEFAALDYTASNFNKYAYMMEGYDHTWNYSENNRYATYTNIRPGEYVFRVKAANANGVWNEQGASIKVIVPPPFWGTWWFRIICILLFSGIVYGIHLFGLVVIRQQKKRLEKLIAIRTHELEEKKNQLEQSEQMYRNLVDTSPDAIMITDMNGTIRMANPQVAGMLDAENVEVVLNRNILDFLQPREREHFGNLLQTLLEKGLLHNVSLSIWLLSGSSITVELNALLIMDRGKPRIMSVFRDIAERKLMEEERVERERMRGVLETAGGVCHELNQPLQVVAGYAEILELTKERDLEEQLGIVQKIRHEVKRMAEITRKLNNITAYRTKTYAGGTRIIDLTRSSEDENRHGDKPGKSPGNRDELR